MSLGYDINVYQESINKVFREFLVNFDYLTRIMDDYGFALVAKEEAISLGLPDGTGMFSELYSAMEEEIKQNPNRKNDYGKSPYMSPEEKQISFMNRYFVFKKVRSLDVKKMSEIILNKDETFGYFTSRREGGKGRDDIYSFRRKGYLLGCYL